VDVKFCRRTRTVAVIFLIWKIPSLHFKMTSVTQNQEQINEPTKEKETLGQRVARRVSDCLEAVEKGWEESVTYETGEALSPGSHTGKTVEKVVEKTEEALQKFQEGWEESVKYESGEEINPEAHTGKVAQKAVEKTEAALQKFQDGWEESVRYESGEELSPDAHSGKAAGKVIEKTEEALQKFQEGWEESVKYESGEALGGKTEENRERSDSGLIHEAAAGLDKAIEKAGKGAQEKNVIINAPWDD
jgi:DNA-directed RNA polymerase subunit L